ncbi:MAG TPA: diacylglycerol kinase family protein, partial [Chthoniobacterales bacterium]|nr:diacylglycerol kinase family protein [Chthoniobacterales bacterium]
TRKTCIILNPSAGKARDLDDIVARMARLPDAEIRLTTKPGSAARFAKTALKNGRELIIAAGGDGTLNEVVNGIGENSGNVQVGLIPLGTGNDFGRSIGVPPDVDAAIDLIRAGETRPVDLVRVTSDEVRYFVNVSAGGFSGLVNEKLTREMKKTWGPLAYLRSAAAALPELRAYRTTLAFDNDESLMLELYNVVVANGRYVAGGMLIAPEAAIDDGLLDVILIPKRPAAELALVVAQMALGTHLSSDAIVYRRTAKLTVNSKPGMWFNVDGELVGNEPARFEIVPRALNFIAPKT